MTPKTELTLDKKIEIIEDGIAALLYRIGRKHTRTEIENPPDSPGIVKAVRLTLTGDEQPIAEYEIRNDPARIVIRMRGGP